MTDAQKEIDDVIAAYLCDDWEDSKLCFAGWSNSGKAMYRQGARRLRKALAAAGLKIVGREPTKVEQESEIIWRAMWDAA